MPKTQEQFSAEREAISQTLERPSGAHLFLGCSAPDPGLLFFVRAKKSNQKKALPQNGALSLRIWPLPRRSPTAPPCARGRGAESFRAPAGFRAKAGDAWGRHMGF